MKLSANGTISVNSSSGRVLDALQTFGIEPAPGSITCLRDGITFEFRSPHAARRVLENRLLFVEGPLGILHRRDVGELDTEYRSYRNGAKHSLHVVLGKNGSAFAHLDRYNPYEGLAGLALHGFFELLPHLAAKAFGALRGRRSGRAAAVPPRPALDQPDV